MFIFLFAYLFQYEVLAGVNIIDKGLIPLEKNSVGIQFYIDVENEERTGQCLVQTWPKKCCLTDAEREDCNIMYLSGANTIILNPKDRETLIYVYPTLYQHDLMGFCVFSLRSKCSTGGVNSQQSFAIPFDTGIPVHRKVSDVMMNYVSGSKRTECSFIDEDSLNDCEPANCDKKYSGARPFFDTNLSKCTEAAVCVGDPEKKLPDIVYVPKSNVCRDLDKPLTVENILEISNGLMITREPELLYKPNEAKLEIVKNNCSTISQNLQLIKDLMTGNILSPTLSVDTTDVKKCIIDSLLRVLCVIALICAVLFLYSCCVHTIATIHYTYGSFSEAWYCFLDKFKSKRPQSFHCMYKVSRVDADVKNKLLKDVLIRDIPIQLRDSVVDICERMEREVRWKKRYRREELGSQVSLGPYGDASESMGDESGNESTSLLNH